MNPSRLETKCKVTLDPVAFPPRDIIPPGLGLLALADIDLHVMRTGTMPFAQRKIVQGICGSSVNLAPQFLRELVSLVRPAEFRLQDGRRWSTQTVPVCIPRPRIRTWGTRCSSCVKLSLDLFVEAGTKGKLDEGLLLHIVRLG